MGKNLKPKTKVGLIAGGSGLTPMYAIALASCLAKDGLEITFLFSNKTKEDILCKELLDDLCRSNPDTFKLFHTLTRHDEAQHGAWGGLTGRVSADMLKQCGFPQPADGVYIATCGPAQFNADIKTFLLDAG